MNALWTCKYDLDFLNSLLIPLTLLYQSSYETEIAGANHLMVQEMKLMFPKPLCQQ